MLGVSVDNRAAAGVSAGQTLDVDIELDTAERTVDVPADLATELAGDDAARAAWDRWSFTRRKEAARLLAAAKNRDQVPPAKVLADLHD